MTCGAGFFYDGAQALNKVISILIGSKYFSVVILLLLLTGLWFSFRLFYFLRYDVDFLDLKPPSSIDLVLSKGDLEHF